MSQKPVRVTAQNAILILREPGLTIEDHYKVKDTVSPRRMVHRAGYCANTSKVSDFIDNIVIPKNAKSETIRDLYLDQGLTALQIAHQIGLSKTVVLRRLHALGIRQETVKQMELEKPRPVSRASYGYRIVSGKLVPDRYELKVVRIIVELRSRQGLSWSKLVKHLNSEKIKARGGGVWHITSVRMVFERWKDKI